MQVFIFAILGVVMVSHNEKIISLSIVVAVVKDAFSFQTVTPRPTTLLNVSF